MVVLFFIVENIMQVLIYWNILAVSVLRVQGLS